MEQKKLTGYPPIDKPWLKYYKQEYIDAPLPNMTAYEYLKTMNAERLDTQAIDSEAGNYTYRELLAVIDATAAALWAMGIRKGKHVLSMFPVLPHESFLFYGVDAVGAALCQIAPQYTEAEVCSHANRIDADLFFVFDDLLTPEMEQMIYQTTRVRNIVAVNFAPMQGRDSRTLSWDAFLEQGKDVTLPEIHRDPTELLFLASTGGSTGEPKSVMLNDNCFNNAVHQLLHSDLPYDGGDRWIRLWPLFSATAAVANNHLPLCAGMCMLIRPFPINISDFDRMITDSKPQHMMLIPQLLDVLENSQSIQNADFRYVKSVGCGGLGITKQFEERVAEFFKKHNMPCFLGFGWGCTESSAVATHRSNRETTVVGTVGAPLVNTIVAAFDPESGEELRYGEEGELCIHSHTLMMGYYNDPELTAKVLRKHADGQVWLHTGDLGTISEDGIVTVKGRMTRMIFVFPTAKIYPQALESAVSKVEGVQEVIFCEIPDIEHDGFFLPVCFIVPDGTCSADEVQTNVEQYCQEAFPDYSRPKHIFIRDYIPLTRVGKPDIRALEKEAVEQAKQ